MTYSKPEITNVVPAVAAVRSLSNKIHNNVEDSGGPMLAKQTSAAYEADE
jgi:hypothetical protein